MKHLFDKTWIKWMLVFLLAAFLLGILFWQKKDDAETKDKGLQTESPQELAEKPSGRDYGFEVVPETGSLILKMGDLCIPAAMPGQERRVADFKQEEGIVSWSYPDEQFSVTVADEKEYLSISMKSQKEGDNMFEWPVVSAKTYYLPLGEGKVIPQDDEGWKEYLSGKEIGAMEQLSMPFWASVSGDYAVLFIMENPYRTSLSFSANGDLGFRVIHEYPEIDPDREKTFRLYLTENDPVSIAKIYKEYVKEQGKFVTLAEKAAENPNIEKLYGAPHIYLWEERIISPEDIRWNAVIAAMQNGELKHITELFSDLESGSEATSVFEQLGTQDYADAYQKNVVSRVFSEVMKRDDLYDAEKFPKLDSEAKSLLEKGIENLNGSEIITFNKHVLAANLPELFKPVEDWMNGGTTDLLKELKDAGIDRAFVGLNDWNQAYAKPELVKAAVEQGYLIGPYDSYHSIHEPGKERWITAAFEDASLYETASVTDKNGKKQEGFQGVGRKLNPLFSFPSVKKRVEEVTAAVEGFNAWFVDCDATGEIYDDYTPGHLTTMQQDLKARLKRMEYIRDEKNMVIGTEGGNDFAAPVIAFAHGIELPTFAYMDPDMNRNQGSPYYIGKYYSPSGGVPEHFGKQIPIKEKFYHIFLDPAYDAPLYKLVYNDSVITGYHWDWSTFKIEGRSADRMLREVLYNTPPLYHLDRNAWEKLRPAIADHTAVWSKFNKEALQREMTDFEYLTSDRLVQMTEYGTDLRVIANFSDTEYSYEGEMIKGHSLLIVSEGDTVNYTPHGE